MPRSTALLSQYARHHSQLGSVLGLLRQCPSVLGIRVPSHLHPHVWAPNLHCTLLERDISKALWVHIRVPHRQSTISVIVLDSPCNYWWTWRVFWPRDAFWNVKEVYHAAASCGRERPRDRHHDSVASSSTWLIEGEVRNGQSISDNDKLSRLGMSPRAWPPKKC